MGDGVRELGGFTWDRPNGFCFCLHSRYVIVTPEGGHMHLMRLGKLN